MRRGVICLGLFMACGLPAQAATTATMTVGAQIIAGCAVNGSAVLSGAALGALGTLDFGSAPSLSVSESYAQFRLADAMALTCTPGVAVSMSVDGGLHYRDGTRNMLRSGGSENVAYALYRDDSHSVAMLPGNAVALDTSKSPSPLTIILYGAATPTGKLPAGDYLDTVTVTIQW
ncbi:MULTISPECIES: Csu type fimbrial protein [Asaia]|uniref:Csu type fimbrial protein n=1 Tax=Asaia TaxID=91914 RepID=UPI002FC2ACDF